jgi:hypothetical protein
VNECLRAQLAELATVHKGLINIEERAGITVVSGALTFDSTPSCLEQIIDSFEVEMRVPQSYPKDLPDVVETGGRIEEGYPHRNPGVGTMCLGAPVQVRLAFMEEPTILGFVNRLVVPFLYGFAYWYRHDEHPFGELEHGNAGIAQYYRRRLGLADDLAVLSFLGYLFEHGFRGHHDCPCGSRRKLRACHGNVARELLRAHTDFTFAKDIMLLFALCHERAKLKQLTIPNPVMDRMLRIHGRLKKATAIR